MPGESFLLSALIPPGSVEAEVGHVQAELFSEHGLASAQAVPPLVPIAFLDSGRLEPEFLSRLNRAAPYGWRVRLGDAGWVQDHLYVRVDSAGAWSTLRACALSQCGIEGGGLFPVAEGFYLGCSEVPPEGRSNIRTSVPARSFGSGTIVLIVLEPAPPGQPWWSDLHWEVTEERPLRGRKGR